jgi:exosortase F-associated protein
MLKKIAYTVLALAGLVIIRAFENTLFYDPFITYFKIDYQFEPFPGFNFWKLILSTAFRYGINALLSVAVIQVLFQEKILSIFSLKFYGLTLLILELIFSVFLVTELGEENKLAFFYVRRFLIQPLFLFILVPAFYYQNLMRKKENSSSTK